MPQLSYNDAPAIAVAGLVADIGPRRTESPTAKEIIAFGLGTVAFAGVDDAVRLPSANSVIAQLDGALVASNVYAITLNGTFTASVTFATSSAATLAAMATALEAFSIVESATVSGNNITILAANNVTFSSIVGSVTGGSGQASFSSTFGTTDTLEGISQFEQREHGPSLVTVNDSATITISGDALNTSDTVTVTINGVTLATVTYATSEAATLTAVANLIAAQNGVASATVSGRVITVLNNPTLPLIINSVVIVDDSASATPPVAAIAGDSQSLTVGVGAVYYDATEPINNLRQGVIYVSPEVAVTKGDSVFCRFISTTGTVRGGFRNDADTNKAFDTGLKYRTSASAGGFAQVAINLP